MYSLNEISKTAIVVGLLLMPGVALANDDCIFTSDDSKNLTQEIFLADFSSIEISRDNIIFYGPDGDVQCKSEYEFVGTEVGPGFNMEGESEWYKFKSMPNISCSAYSYIVATKIDTPEGMTYWSIRYGNTSFDDLINNPEYAIWSPTLTSSDFTAERLAERVNEDEEEAEGMGALLWSRKESQISLEDWSGKWITTGTLIDDPALNPFYQAVADAANAICDQH